MFESRNRNQPLRLLTVCLLLSAAALRVAPAAEPEPPWNVNPVGRMGGWCWAVKVVGSWAYVGEGGRLTILDISDPSSPRPVGSLSFDDYVIEDLYATGSFAYLVGPAAHGQHGLQVIDVTTPSSPRLRSFYSTPIQARGVYVSDGLAYVACGRDLDYRGGLQIIDVSDPSSPTLRYSFIMTPLYAWKVFVSDNIGYVAARDGLHLFDVTNPSLVSHLAVYDQYQCNDVWAAGGLAYTASYDGLEVIDVTSPTAPARRGHLWGNPALGISVSDGMAFLAQTGGDGLGIVEVTNPSSCTLIGSVPPAIWRLGMSWDVAVSNSTAFLGDGPGGVSIVDATIPSSPTLRAVFGTASDTQGVHVAGDVAYLANGVRGFKTVDVSNPQSPTILGSLATAGPADRIDVSGEFVCICGTSGYPTTNLRAFLQIIDVTTPSSPSPVGSYERRGAFGPFAVRDDWAYIIHSEGLQIVDISDPSSPTLRGTFEALVLSSDIFVSGDLAFIADYSSLKIVDVSDPESPFLRSSFPGSAIREVFVANGVAYITGTWAQANFACIDVTNPDAPTLLGTYDLAGYEYESGGLYVSNGLAYVLLDGIRVLDISDPTVPTLCGLYPSDRSTLPSDVFASGDLVYLTDINGLRIFQFTGDSAARRAWGSYK